MPKKTVFNSLWTNPVHHPRWSTWIEAAPKDKNAARCKLCQKTFSLSNMGQQAIVSHEKGDVHKKIANPSDKQASVANFFAPKTSNISSVTTSPKTSATLPNPAASAGKIQNYFQSQEVTNAEIIWCLKVIESHFSYRSCSDIGVLFKAMFTDSDIAQRFSLGKTKIAYNIAFGIAPYFENQLLEELRDKQFVICFDEALNKVVQRGQMDLVVKYWSDTQNKVSTRYLNSVFMGHQTAHDLIKAFKQGISSLDISKLVQVSMDGPNVNLKFFKALKEELKSGENETQVLDLGSCGLHVVHGAFQTGHKAAKWTLNSFLRGIYGLFKDSPARRADFTTLTGSSAFPKKFCQIRWTENALVARTAISLYPAIKKYMKETNRLPCTVSIAAVKEGIKDNLIIAKLEFFVSVATALEPFLTSFQSPAPMAPFLYEALEKLLRKILKRFVKRDVLNKANTARKLMKLDVSSTEIMCPPKDVDIGVAASSEIKKAHVSDRTRLEFRMECRKFLSSVCEKLINRCPLKFTFTRLISSISPTLITRNMLTAETRFNDLVKEMYASGHISADEADKAKDAFPSLCEDERLSNFQKDKDRLDEFFYNLLSTDNEKQELWKVLKISLILSHGNADVESGFSVNGDMLVENLHERSLVAQRRVYDGIKAAGGISNVNLGKLRPFLKGASTRYQQSLENKKIK